MKKFHLLQWTLKRAHLTSKYQYLDIYLACDPSIIRGVKSRFELALSPLVD